MCPHAGAPFANFAFRGGTASHKLSFKQPLRYSEDVDLVQTQSPPIGTSGDAVREDWQACDATMPPIRPILPGATVLLGYSVKDMPQR